MKGTHLGEFEELVLLTVGILFGDAYGVAIKEEVYNQTGRKVKIGSIHSALNRLEEKGYVISEMGGATTERGGRRKRLFTITDSGTRVLAKAREQRNRMWAQLPEVVLKTIPS